ncbi:hypothetical protein RINTHH_12380 [Richelia intracellularis HH01]|uniref:Uncharacterized protein n=1 Tax=Richelia intracellularis HH01 TaxID=1165094 RepID=M1X0A0_9NOST|nr:hypothetical protein RINTHH_12380 [Richelia intracellularis HH01]
MEFRASWQITLVPTFHLKHSKLLPLLSLQVYWHHNNSEV